MKTAHPLETLMADPRFDGLVGRAASIRLDILAARTTGRTLAEIAARRGVSKQAMTKHARRVAELYGCGKEEVDSAA